MLCSRVQMLVLSSDWQAALPILTELGNGLALISSLDVTLRSHGDAVSMQLAPMLGITLTAAAHLQCMVGAAVSVLCRIAPGF